MASVTEPRSGTLRKLTGVLLLPVVLSASNPAQAVQSPGLAEQRERVASLHASWENAVAEAARADSVLDARVRLDSLVAGPILVLLSPEYNRFPHRSLRRARDELVAVLGSDSTLLDGVAFYFPSTSRREGAPHLPDRDVISIPRQRILGGTHARSIVVAARQWFAGLVDSSLTQWSGQTLPMTTSPMTAEDVWIELMTAPSSLGRRCLEGNLSDCRTGLGLTTVRDSIRDWYDEASRRSLIASLPGLVRRDMEAASVCIDREWDEICIAIIEKMNGVPPPLTYDIRGHFLWFVLKHGGEGVYSRIVRRSRTAASDAGPIGLMEASSGSTVDEWLEMWQRTIAASRPRPVILQPPLVILASLWVLGFGGWSLVNSRWR